MSSLDSDEQTRVRDMRSFLQSAAVGDERGVKQYLRRGGDPDELFSHVSAVHVAIANSQSKCLRLLQECGADVHALTAAGESSVWRLSGDGSWTPVPLKRRRRWLLALRCFSTFLTRFPLAAMCFTALASLL